MARKAAKKIRYLVLPNGGKSEITGENGKYWFCGETQWRKSHGWNTEEVATPREKQADDIDEKGEDE